MSTVAVVTKDVRLEHSAATGNVLATIQNLIALINVPILILTRKTVVDAAKSVELMRYA